MVSHTVYLKGMMVFTFTSHMYHRISVLLPVLVRVPEYLSTSTSTSKSTMTLELTSTVRVPEIQYASTSTEYEYPSPAEYRNTSDISGTLLGNKIVDHSEVVGASPAGAAPTTSSFST